MAEVTINQKQPEQHDMDCYFGNPDLDFVSLSYITLRLP
jgi:hypothetical protein